MVEHTKIEQRNTKLYLREFMPAMIGYVAAVAVTTPFIADDDLGDWRYLLAIIPVIPAVAAGWAIARYIQRSDEMQRAIFLNGLALGFGAMILTSFTLGFLAAAGLNTDPWGMWVVFSAGGIGWIVGSVATTVRLR